MKREKIEMVGASNNQKFTAKTNGRIQGKIIFVATTARGY
jgi:hypothetical protein